MRRTTEESSAEELRDRLDEEVLSEEPVVGNGKERIIGALRLGWSRRGFLVRAAVAGLVIGGLIAFLIPKRYQSAARLMPPDSAQASSGLAMAAAMMSREPGSLTSLAGDLLGFKTTGALFVGILNSRTVADRLIERFSLRQVYHVTLWEDARKILASKTDISEDRKSGIITLWVTDENPQRATALAQAYVEELDRLVAQLSTSAARREREFIEQRLKAVKLDLDAASKDFSEFSSKNMTVDIKEQGRAMVEAAATLEGNLIAAESEMKMLEEIYTDQNVRVRSARARVNELRQQLEKLGGTGSDGQAGSHSETEATYPAIRKLPLLGVTYADLYRRVKIQEAVFEALSQQYEMAKVQEAKEIPSIKVLDAPVVPERKSFPPRLLIMLSTSFLAFICGAIWVLGDARWQGRDRQDAGVIFTEEVLAAVQERAHRISLNGYEWSSLREKFLKRWKSGKDVAPQ